MKYPITSLIASIISFVASLYAYSYVKYEVATIWHRVPTLITIVIVGLISLFSIAITLLYATSPSLHIDDDEEETK